MKVASVAQVVHKDNIATPQENINQSVHNGWGSLAACRSMTKEQEPVAQNSNTTDNILALEVDKTHSRDTRDNVVCQGIGRANDPVGNDKECHRTGLHKVRIDVHVFGHLGKNCRSKIVVDVRHDKLP